MCSPEKITSCHVQDVIESCDIIFLTHRHAVLCPIREVEELGNEKRMCPLKENKTTDKEWSNGLTKQFGKSMGTLKREPKIWSRIELHKSKCSVLYEKQTAKS